MQKLIDFYSQVLERYVGEYDSVKRRLRLLSTSRLLAFIGTVLLIFFFRDQVKWATGFSIAGLVLFLFLVRYYEDTKMKFRLAHALVKINRTELKVLHHEYDDLPNGEEYIDAQHPYSHDMDLFGKGSFFQYLNRTQLIEGKDLLAQLIMANDIEAIGAKQEAIDELAQKPDWRQQFTGQASLIEQEMPTVEVIKWLKAYVPFVPDTMRFLPWLFLQERRQGYAEIVCLKADLDIDNGRVETHQSVLETRRVQLVGTGTIDLRNDRISFTAEPRPVGQPLSRSAWPIEVSGSLKSPKVSVAQRTSRRALVPLAMPEARTPCVPDIAQLRETEGPSRSHPR